MEAKTRSPELGGKELKAFDVKDCKWDVYG